LKQDLNNKTLQIVNASAGSGKTFHLVKEYITLLIQDKEDFTSFNAILAMTFTNKAALEMKERILKALDEISSPLFFQNSAQDLTNLIAEETNLKPNEVIARCKRVLTAILHQFEEFHVMTIDKFNLRLIKSFSRDLDLPSDFEIVMDETEIIEKIVDDLLNQIGTAGNDKLTKLLFKYAQTNIDEGLSWNFRRNLIEFGKILKSERNTEYIKRLMELNLSTDAFGELIASNKKIDTSYFKIGLKLKKSIESSGLTKSDISHGTHAWNALQKLISERLPVSDNILGATLNKAIATPTSGKELPAEWISIINEIEVFHNDNCQQYEATNLFLKNFFNMALLQYMAASLDEIKKSEQIIRISEFNTLISTLIQEENAPFIYERLGNKFKHYLLDEFQDTSHLQWLNLVPLIHESISKGHLNLIVGDPKQSIYRFKNGIAEQFIELPGIYNPDNNAKITEKSNYFRGAGNIQELDNNWRSSPTIVNFNNQFFDSFKKAIPPRGQSFYSSTFQHAKSKSRGKISISSFPKEDDFDVLNIILAQIEEAKSLGFKLGDICILGGRNNQCNQWAIGLTENGIKVVSSDSLLIYSDLKVKLSIAYLKWRFRPFGENEMKRFAELFFRISEKSYNEYQNYIETKVSSNGKNYKVFNYHLFLNTFFGGSDQFFFKYENLYDLIQGFFSLMNYNELDNSYLHHLADVIYEFGQKRGPDLKQFIKQFEATKGNIAVQIPESDDAVKIMTIHKSKGLEFPVVIIPSLNFSLDLKSKLLVDVQDYILYEKPSKNSIIHPLHDLYNSETEQVLIDCLNLCYVGLTRPKDCLFITNTFDKKKDFSGLFHSVLGKMEGVVTNGDRIDYFKDDGVVVNKQHDKSFGELFEPKPNENRLWFPDIALQDNQELNSENILSVEQQLGNQFHYLTSVSNNISELESELSKGILSGVISIENKDTLFKALSKLFDHEEFQNFVKDSIEILDEQSIILDTSTILRPDKIIIKNMETIIIDFKTGIPNQKDIKQVSLYKSTLESMGYKNVSSYLYYSSLNEFRIV